MGLYQITSPTQQGDPSVQAGMNQYMQQGMAAPNPGVNPANQGQGPAMLGQILGQLAKQQQNQPGNPTTNLMQSTQPSTDDQWKQFLASPNAQGGNNGSNTSNPGFNSAGPSSPQNNPGMGTQIGNYMRGLFGGGQQS